jgi:hypothetical protein
MLCDNYTEAENYRGLDCDRDTEEEIETIARFFPDVLSRRKEIVWGVDVFEEEILGNCYPIQSLAVTRDVDGTLSHYRSNMKAVSFIPAVARLAIELGLFEEQYRGGLLIENDNDGENVLHDLMRSGVRSIEYHNREDHEPIDEKYLHVLIKLKKMDLLKKEDIQMYGLMRAISPRNGYYFAEKRFRLLVEWDPNVFTRYDDARLLLLHYTDIHGNSIRGFRSVFDAGIRYFPKKKGISLLFCKKGFNNRTPFQYACGKFGYDNVMEVVEDILVRYSDIPIDMADALLSAVIDENVHLDCVYFLLRREPDILIKILSNSSPLMISAVCNRNNNNDNDSNNNNSNDKNDGTSKYLGKTKKLSSATTITERKRKGD